MKSDSSKRFIYPGIPAMWAVLSLLVLFSCGGWSNKNADGKVKDSGHTFTLPEIPSALNDRESRAEYLVLHYWDNFDFADTLIIRDAEIAEQAFVDYIVLLPHVAKEAADASIRSTLENAHGSEAVHRWFRDMYENYLYDPNSPFRDEEYYATVVESVIGDPRTDGPDKIRPAFQLEEINKNRVGTVAANFTYTLAGGSAGTLHRTRAEYTLLYFHNPDCPDCNRTKEVLEYSDVIDGMRAAGKLKILALYPDGDVQEWKTCEAVIPPGWINARDGSPDLVVRNKLYAIRATPSLYLLDRDKQVILKDATVNEVMGELENVE